MPEQPSYRWRVIGQSVRGASHLRSGAPNQDAIKIRIGTQEGFQAVLAVSDGHGSPKSFRSEKGADTAVRVASRVVLLFLKGVEPPPSAEVRERAVRKLTGDIVKIWREHTKRSHSKQPFTEQELKLVERQAGASAREAVLKNPHLAYGATLLVVAVGHGMALYLQLGDGDILTVSDSGSDQVGPQVKSPLPDDPSLIANETTSLSMPDAERAFRVVVQELGPNAPALFLASTDGYSNSFTSQADFRQVGVDLLKMIKQPDGLDVVDRELAGWLDETSKCGSGDDVSLGIICREDIIGRPLPQPEITPDEAAALAAVPAPTQPQIAQPEEAR